MFRLLQGIQAINEKIFKDDRYGDASPCLQEADYHHENLVLPECYFRM